MAELNIPKTPIYTAPDKPLQIPTAGLEQLGRAAARVGEMGAQVERYHAQEGEALDRGLNELGRGTEAVGQQLQQHENITDLNNINTAHASTLLSLTQAQQKFFADPANQSNPQAAEQFQEQFVRPAVDALNAMAQTRTGQEHASNLTDTLETHFVQTSAQQYAANAAKVQKDNLQYVQQALTSATQMEPGNIPASLNAYDTMMQQYAAQHPEVNASLDAPERLEARKQIIASGLATYIDKTTAGGGTPNLAPFYQKYGTELGGPEQQKLNEYATARQRAYQEQQKSNQATQRQVDEHVAKQAASQLTASVIETGPNGPTGNLVVPKDFYANVLNLGSLPGANEGQIKSSIELARSIQNQPPGYHGAHDDTTFNSLVGGMFGTPGAPGTTSQIDLDKARIAGKVTDQEYTELSRGVEHNDKNVNPYARQNLNTAQTTVKAYLNPSGPGNTTEALSVQRFTEWFWPQYAAKLQGGEDPFKATQELVTQPNMDLHGTQAATPNIATTQAPSNAPEQSPEDWAAGKIGSFFTGLFGGATPRQPATVAPSRGVAGPSASAPIPPKK